MVPTCLLYTSSALDPQTTASILELLKSINEQFQITITSEELRERVEDHLDRWIPDDIHTEPEWAWSLADQVHKLGIPVFMKEDLVPDVYKRQESGKRNI